MSTQFKLSKSMAVAVMAAVMLCACDSGVQREGQAEATLRVVRTDAARNRLWILEADALTLYDNTTGRQLRRMALPEWVLVGARYSCPPDLALDSSGAAFISSNVLPVLWRVGPERFEITRIELALHADADKDVGFTGLSFAGDGTLLAAGTTFGSLWHLDPRAASARKIASYPALTGTCDPAALLLASRAHTGVVTAAPRPK